MAKLSNDNIAKYRPQTRNGNKHTQRGMGMLESSMRQYGYVSPMTAAADGEIIDGSARIETSANVFGDDAIVVHHDGTKPIIMVRDDIPSADTPEARAISMAANRIAQVNLDFDAEVILGDLQAGVDLSQFWRKDELDELLADLQPKTTGDTPAETDRAEELRQKWQTAPGQLWQLGEHRLVCGDCTDAATVARVMGGEKAQAVVTSPPYGVGMEYEGAPVQADTVDLVSRCFAVACPLVVKNGFAFVNFGERYVWDVPMVQVYHGIFKALGWRWYDQRFWKRSQVGMAIWNTTQPRAMSQVEYLFTFQNGNAVYPVHDLSISKEQLWDDAGSSSDMNHPAVMALGIAEKAVTIYSAGGDVVYEPFSGSGTTIIACENLGRKCRACEISPAYAAVALERWSVHTGRQPVLIEGA